MSIAEARQILNVEKEADWNKVLEVRCGEEGGWGGGEEEALFCDTAIGNPAT